MKKRLFALALVGCMAFSMTAFAEESTEGTSEGSVDLSAVETVTDGKLTVATSPDFAPYEFYAIDEDVHRHWQVLIWRLLSTLLITWDWSLRLSP